MFIHCVWMLNPIIFYRLATDYAMLYTKINNNLTVFIGYLANPASRKPGDTDIRPDV